MLIPHKGHTDTIQVYSVTVMTHVKALQAGHSSQGTSEPITPALVFNSVTSNAQKVEGPTSFWVSWFYDRLLGQSEFISLSQKQ